MLESPLFCQDLTHYEEHGKIDECVTTYPISNLLPINDLPVIDFKTELLFLPNVVMVPLQGSAIQKNSILII
jgi:hypothetical protein